MTKINSTTLDELRSGWPVLAAATTGMACGTVHIYSLGTLMIPLSEAHGWTRAEISASLLITTLGAVLFGPLVGRLVDRLGVRPVAIAAMTFYCVCIAGLGLTGPRLWVWYLIWGLISVVQAVVTGGIWLKAITGCFAAARGLAIGTTMAGAGITGAIAPLLISSLSESHGLARAMLLIASGTFAVSTVAIWRLVEPSQRRVVAEACAPLSDTGLTMGQAVLSREFWRLAVSLFVVAGAAAITLVHMQPIMIDGGMSRVTAAGIAGIAGPFVIVGRLGVGLLLDRFHGPTIAAFSFIVPAVNAFLLIQFDGSILLAYTIAALAGLAAGIEADIMAYLCAKYFGLRSYATIFGIFAGIYGVGYAGLVAAGGWVADLTGSYDAILWPVVVAALAASALILTLGPYTDRVTPEPALRPRRTGRGQA